MFSFDTESVPHDPPRSLNESDDVTLYARTRTRREVQDPGESQDDVDDGEDVVKPPVVLEVTEFLPKVRMLRVSLSERPIEENIYQ